MNHRIALSLLSFATAILLLSTAFAYRAFAQAEIRIDSGVSCTAACHTDLAKKKKQVHPVAASGTNCATMCHQPLEKGRHTFKPMPANKTELCTMCHQQPAGKHQHMPVKAGLCTTCHDPHQSDHGMLLRKPAGELCLMCHEDRASKAHKHMPVQVGLCTTCHSPHQSDHGGLLNKPSPELCYQCHQPARFKGKVVHGPVAEGKCLDCHAPHSAEKKKLLDKTPPELCLGCHSAQLKDAQGRMLPSTKNLLDDKEATLHPPFAGGQCSFCHQPHASESARLTSKGYPADFYAAYAKDDYGLCFTCHSSKTFEEPRTLAETQFRNGNLNLHHRHVNRDKGRSCGACHSPHGSRQPKLIQQNFQFGKRILPLKFEKTDTGGSCTTACHAPIKYDRCEPEPITMRTTPRQGEDASQQELKPGCEQKK